MYGIYEEAEEIKPTLRGDVDGYEFIVRNYGNVGMYWDGPSTTRRDGKRYFVPKSSLPEWKGVSPERTLKECVNRGYEELFEEEV